MKRQSILWKEGITSILALLILALISCPSLAYDYFKLPGIKGYKPPQGFPWDFKPKTAEQVEYLYHAAERQFDRFGNSNQVLVDDRGHIRQQIIIWKFQYAHNDYGDPHNPLDDYGDVLDYEDGKVKHGDVKSKIIFQWPVPPEFRARQFVVWDYMDSPHVRKDAERWLYLPSARRIRRLSGGDREDSIGGGEWTYDDLTGREVFEWEQTFLGEDVLYPKDLQYDEKLWKIRLKNPVECYVVESKPKIPDYYLSKRILWAGKERSLPYREEQYDKKGNLWKIFNFYYALYPLEKNPLVKSSFITFNNAIDIKINHRTLNWHKFVRYGVPVGTVPEEHFQPEFMRRESFIRPEAEWKEVIPLIKSTDELPKPPRLMLNKFKEHRPIAEDVVERLKKKYGEQIE